MLRPAGLPKETNKSLPVQPGRGAEAPQEIPAKGWWQTAKRVAKKFSENELMSEAAGCTFCALLALFPAITAIVSIYGLFADRSNIEEQLNGIATFLPSGGVDIIREQVYRLAQSPTSGLSAGAAIGLLTALWSANAGTKAMFSALNDVYGEREQRGILRVTATSLAFTGGDDFLVITGHEYEGDPVGLQMLRQLERRAKPEIDLENDDIGSLLNKCRPSVLFNPAQPNDLGSRI